MYIDEKHEQCLCALEADRLSRIDRIRSTYLACEHAPATLPAMVALSISEP